MPLVRHDLNMSFDKLTDVVTNIKRKQIERSKRAAIATIVSYFSQRLNIDVSSCCLSAQEPSAKTKSYRLRYLL